jgi:hypothetical protein
MATEQFASLLEAMDPVAALSGLVGTELREKMRRYVWSSLSFSDESVWTDDSIVDLAGRVLLRTGAVVGPSCR